MWVVDRRSGSRGGVFSTPPPNWTLKALPSPPLQRRFCSTTVKKKPNPSPPPSPDPNRRHPNEEDDPLFHVLHKIPTGHSPYVRAKQVQLIERDPGRAISLFWAAINQRDRVDSSLKDMAVVMKQLNRSDEAIEAIKSFRHLCSPDSQESLDNVMVELYKRSGRLEEEIELLHYKLKCIDEGMAFGGKKTKTARSQGKKIQITISQEKSRLLGNLAWAHLQKNNYKTAEQLYLRALSLEPDRNKECNLAICWMNMDKVDAAKSLLESIIPPAPEDDLNESYVKSYDRAFQTLQEMLTPPGEEGDSSHGSSPITVLRINGESLDYRDSLRNRTSSPKCSLPLSSGYFHNMKRGGAQESTEEAMARSTSRRLTFEKMKSPYGMQSSSTKERTGMQDFHENEKERGRQRRRSSCAAGRGKNMRNESTDASCGGGGAMDSDIGRVENMTNVLQKMEKKSWADMVEEDEEEELRTNGEKKKMDKGEHRLQVFKEIALFPESPRSSSS